MPRSPSRGAPGVAARPSASAAGPAPPERGLGDAEQSIDDSWRLLVLIGVSALASLIVVGALVGAVAIDTWWSLTAAVVVHLVMTVAVFGAVAFLLSGHVALRGRRHRVPLRTAAPVA